MGVCILGEVTGKVNSIDRLQSRNTSNGTKVSVVSNLINTIDLSELRQGHVHQVRVGSEDEITGGSQVGSRQGSERIRIESQKTIGLLQGRQFNLGQVAESHVLGGLEVREDNLKTLVVGGERSKASDVLDLVDVNLSELVVVVDIDRTDGLEGDTFERSQAGVRNQQLASRLDALVEAQHLKSGQGLEVNRADLLEVSELEVGHLGERGEGEGVADLLEVVCGEGSDVCGALCLEGALDLLDAFEVELAGDGLVDGEVTLDGGAGGEVADIALRFDSDVLAFWGWVLME